MDNSQAPSLMKSNLFGFTNLCKGLVVVLAAGYAVQQFFLSAVTYLALIPGKYGVKFTNLCKGLVVVLAAGYAVQQFFPSAVTYLALIPGKTIPFPWNLVTAGYVEQSVVGLIVSIVGLLFIGKLLEPIWGPKELFKFIFIVNILTSICVFITMIALYYTTRQESFLYVLFHQYPCDFLVHLGISNFKGSAITSGLRNQTTLSFVDDSLK